jgi:hypothetical protein
MDNEKHIEELAYLRKEIKRLRRTLNELSPDINMLLKRRGFIIYKKEPVDDLFVPLKKFQNRFYRMLHKYSFRLLLRDVIKHQKLFTLEQVTKYAAPSITNGYLDCLLSVKLIRKKGAGYVLAKGPIRSFGVTLEWYIAEIFKREFGSESVWGVKFKRPRIGGDYDVIAKLDTSLIYSEVKSSPPKQIYDSEIAAFLDRVADLAPAVAIFLIDTELRMKDKIVPMFENELARRFSDPPSVERVERELFQINGRIFIVNAKESITGNIGKVLNRYYLRSENPA